MGLKLIDIDNIDSLSSLIRTNIGCEITEVGLKNSSE
jgi:hypothetical protein